MMRICVVRCILAIPGTSPAEVWWRPNTVRGLVGCVFVGHRQASPYYRTRQLRPITLVTWYSFLHFIRFFFFFVRYASPAETW